VFWGGCVVFWCSFWVGFWLSESLRGVFTPARNGRLQSPLIKGGKGRGEGGFEADTLTNFGSAIGINALQARVNALRARVNALRTRVNALQTRVNALRARVNALRTRVNALQTRVNALRTRVNALRTRVHLYQSQGQSLQLPPSLRFPPLREGNRVGRVGSVPPARRGTLRRGCQGCFRARPQSPAMPVPSLRAECR
jgi:outer membrane murein-binding lipoprotein Lpp